MGLSMSPNWERIKGRFKELLPETIFRVWFSPLNGDILEDSLIIEVPNEFTKTWLQENYKSVINQVLREFGLKDIKFLVSEKKSPEQLIIPYNPIQVVGRRLSPKYTFEDFSRRKMQ
jgi:chromosomal replication initiator protein